MLGNILDLLATIVLPMESCQIKRYHRGTTSLNVFLITSADISADIQVTSTSQISNGQIQYFVRGMSGALVSGAEHFQKGFAGLPAERQVPGWQNWQIKILYC